MVDGENGEISGNAVRIADPAKKQGQDRVIDQHNQMEDESALDQLARKQVATPSRVRVRNAKLQKFRDSLPKVVNLAKNVFK